MVPSGWRLWFVLFRDQHDRLSLHQYVLFGGVGFGLHSPVLAEGKWRTAPKHLATTNPNHEKWGS